MINQNQIYIVIVVMYFLCGCSVTKAEPTTWRVPAKAEYIYSWSDIKDSSETPYHIEADFNGDSIRDQAWLLISDASSEWGVFVYLFDKNGKHKTYTLIKNRINDERMQNYNISLLPSGSYKTACSKGYGKDCKEGGFESIVFKNASINYSMFEGSSSVFYWDNERKDFKQAWLSD